MQLMIKRGFFFLIFGSDQACWRGLDGKVGLGSRARPALQTIATEAKTRKLILFNRILGGTIMISSSCRSNLPQIMSHLFSSPAWTQSNPSPNDFRFIKRIISCDENKIYFYKLSDWKRMIQYFVKLHYTRTKSSNRLGIVL